MIPGDDEHQGGQDDEEPAHESCAQDHSEPSAREAHRITERGRPAEVGLRNDVHRRASHEHAPHQRQHPVQQAQNRNLRRPTHQIDIDIHGRRDALTRNRDAQHQHEMAPEQDERAVQDLADGQGTQLISRHGSLPARLGSRSRDKRQHEDDETDDQHQNPRLGQRPICIENRWMAKPSP